MRMALMTSSRWGLFFRAIRENEEAAAAAGVKVVRFRVLVFAIASAFAGLAGGFYGHYIGILTPDIGSVDQMGLVVAMAVIGGAESLIAAMIGAIGWNSWSRRCVAMVSGGWCCSARCCC